MSTGTSVSAVLAGQALVLMHDGSSYRGHAVVDRKTETVTIDGRLRVVSFIGGRATVTYRRRRRQTFDIGLVRVITWEPE